MQLKFNMKMHAETETRKGKSKQHLTVGTVQITDASGDQMSHPLANVVTISSCSAIISVDG